MGAKIVVEPFKREHIEPELERPSLRYLKKHIDVERIRQWETCGHSFTAKDHDGKVLAMGGIVPMWDNVGEAWAIFCGELKDKFLCVHNFAREFLKTAPFHRIQMTVVYDFKNGHRWARLLGFSKEADRLAGYLPDGRDVSMYALVRR